MDRVFKGFKQLQKIIQFVIGIALTAIMVVILMQTFLGMLFSTVFPGQKNSPVISLFS
jgi:hypothetical protein